MFIGSYSKTLLNSTTNLSTPIHSYFPSTLRSILSRRIYRLPFPAPVAAPALLATSDRHG